MIEWGEVQRGGKKGTKSLQSFRYKAAEENYLNLVASSNLQYGRTVSYIFCFYDSLGPVNYQCMVHLCPLRRTRSIILSFKIAQIYSCMSYFMTYFQSCL